MHQYRLYANQSPSRPGIACQQLLQPTGNGDVCAAHDARSRLDLHRSLFGLEKICK